MKHHHHFQSVPRGITLSLGFLLLGLSAPVFGDNESSSAAAPDTTTNAPDVEVPKSVFAIPSKATEGRDPFFPLSQRFKVNSATTQTPVAKVVPVTLALKGISGTSTKRYALINDKTFTVGEEREIAVGPSRIRVRCLEIREDSATVEANGTRQELHLPPSRGF
jgi:hypothetical protein